MVGNRKGFHLTLLHVFTQTWSNLVQTQTQNICSSPVWLIRAQQARFECPLPSRGSQSLPVFLLGLLLGFLWLLLPAFVAAAKTLS